MSEGAVSEMVEVGQSRYLRKSKEVSRSVLKRKRGNVVGIETGNRVSVGNGLSTDTRHPEPESPDLPGYFAIFLFFGAFRRLFSFCEGI